MPLPQLTPSIPFPSANLHLHAHAVIDIGSNSVRMVVYHAPVRVPMPLFNEKYYCALGKGVGTSGQLNPKGVEHATAAIGRFVVMARRLDVAEITVLATAAIRDAQDGPQFVKLLEKKYGIHPLIISGEREADLSAKGVLASMYDPMGISADLGGGSLELAHIHRDHIESRSSFELGVLRLLDDSGSDVGKMRKMIQKELKQVEWLQITSVDTLYAIGGSFRAIAKMQMRQTGYPLPILHEYKLPYRLVEKLVEYLSKLSTGEIADLPGVSSKRAITILPGVLMLQQLMETAHTPHVVFSVTGLREGLLFDKLTPDQQQIDPLLASAQDLAALAGRRGRYAQELFLWMQPLFEQESSERQRLRKALCTLSELAWTIDPNFRAEWAYLRVIQSAMKGVTHRERVMLAMALYHRYQNKWKQERAEIQLLDEQDRLWARCVGIAANLAFHLSGGKQGNLHHARLLVDGPRISLELDEEASPLCTATVEKRLEGLGSTFKALSNFVI